MFDILHREAVYLWYYFTVQLDQIFWYWVLGMVIGSAVSVFLKDQIYDSFYSLGKKTLGIMGVVAASALGIASPVYVWHNSHCRFFFQKRISGRLAGGIYDVLYLAQPSTHHL